MKKILYYLETSIVPFLAAITLMIVTASIFQSIYQGMIALHIGITKGWGQLKDGGKLSLEITNMMSRDVTYFISVASVLICGIVFCFWYRKETIGQQKGTFLSIAKAENIYQFAMLSIGCQLFFSGVMSLVRPVFPEQFEHYGDAVEGIFGSNLLLVLVYTVIIAPVSEELIFRGVILFRTRKVLPFLGANVLQALFFGIYHRNMVQGIYATVIGFLFGLLYRKYNSILASILLHMMINASIILVMFFPETVTSYTIMAVAGAGAGILAFLRLRLWKELAP